MASCFAYEIAPKLLCEGFGVSHIQSEGGEREHGGDNIVAEDYQYLSVGCVDFEELLGIVCCKHSKMLQNREIIYTRPSTKHHTFNRTDYNSNSY